MGGKPGEEFLLHRLVSVDQCHQSPFHQTHPFLLLDEIALNFDVRDHKVEGRADDKDIIAVV